MQTQKQSLEHLQRIGALSRILPIRHPHDFAPAANGRNAGCDCSIRVPRRAAALGRYCCSGNFSHLSSLLLAF